MQNIADFMSTGHRECDVAFAIAEQAASEKNWSTAEIAFNDFSVNMARHFLMEEDKLFPMLLSAGGPDAPVNVMVMEHAQMNELIDQIAHSLEKKESETYGGLSETLLIMMQQHNLKEEQILYPIADKLLEDQRENLINSLRSCL